MNGIESLRKHISEPLSEHMRNQWRRAVRRVVRHAIAWEHKRNGTTPLHIRPRIRKGEAELLCRDVLPAIRAAKDDHHLFNDIKLDLGREIMEAQKSPLEAGIKTSEEYLDKINLSADKFNQAHDKLYCVLPLSHDDTFDDAIRYAASRRLRFNPWKARPNIVAVISEYRAAAADFVGSMQASLNSIYGPPTKETALLIAGANELMEGLEKARAVLQPLEGKRQLRAPKP